MRVATYVLTAAGEAATAEEVLAGLSAHAAGRGWGRPRLAVSPSELLAWWEGRRRRRPRSVREIARKLGISEGTVRHRLRELRAAGKVDDAARARAIAARGGPTAAAGPPIPSTTPPSPPNGEPSSESPAGEAPRPASPPSPATCTSAGDEHWRGSKPLV